MSDAIIDNEKIFRVASGSNIDVTVQSISQLLIQRQMIARGLLRTPEETESHETLNEAYLYINHLIRTILTI